MGTHKLSFQPSGHERFLPRDTTQEHRQGALLLLKTDDSPDKAVLATDSTTNRSMAGIVYGFDRPAGDTADVYCDIGEWRARLPMAITAPNTGGTVTMTGSAGSLDTLSVDGVDILGGAVPFDTSLNQTAINAAAQINAGGGDFYAWQTATGVINIRPRVATKASYVIESTVTTLDSTDVNLSAGVVPASIIAGADAYVESPFSVKPSGTAKIGTFDDLLDENGEVVKATAGIGSVRIDDSAANSISQVTVGESTTLMGSAVTWATSNANTAKLLAAEINKTTSTHGYFAVARGDTTYIHQTTSTINEDWQAVTVTGSMGTQAEPVKNGERARPLVKGRPYGAVLT